MAHHSSSTRAEPPLGTRAQNIKLWRTDSNLNTHNCSWHSWVNSILTKIHNLYNRNLERSQIFVYFTFVFMNVYVHIYVYIYVCIYIYIHTFIKTNVHICLYMWVYTDIAEYYIHVHKHVHVHTCIHEHTHTYVHTHVYIMYFHDFKIHPDLKQSHGTVVEKRPPLPGTYSVMWQATGGLQSICPETSCQ